jgi:hypothetical protein
MTAIGIDLDIGDAVKAIDDMMERRASAETTVWESLRVSLEAIGQAIMALDEMYLSLLAEIEDISQQSQPSADRIAAVLRQGRSYCSDRKLLARLIELRASVSVAAFHDDLKRRRYRDIASTLRSIDTRLGTYIERLQRFQEGNLAETPHQGGRWDLKSLLDILAKKSSLDLRADDGTPITQACEDAIRNFDGALSADLWSLIGRARQQLTMARLR